MSQRTSKLSGKSSRGAKRRSHGSTKALPTNAALDAAYTEAVAREARRRRRTRRRRYLLAGVLVLCMAAALSLQTHQRSVLDWWSLRSYHAPSAISSLSSQTTMTPYATRVFDVNHPVIKSTTTFSGPCPNDGGERTIVLGCYHSDQRGIYLLGVQDPLLNGVEQVTAAHEMLHAAYDRLSPSERQQVDAMLEAYYQHGLHDPRVQATIAAYKTTEPHDVVNEMHSVFGTEVANLPPNLEQYYRRYFTNRQQVVAYAAKYQAEFTSRRDIITRDDAALAGQKSQINELENSLGVQLTAINGRQATLVRLRSSDVAAYNAAVPGYNQQVDTYNSGVVRLHQLIDQYNQLVVSRNAVALEEDQLVQELSSRTGSLHQ